MFEVKELSFSSGNNEPFQLGFFIFDCETQVKLSETFTMSTSPEMTSAGDPTSFIVWIQQLRPTVCLGVTIFHRFSEDYDDAIDPYIKPVSHYSSQLTTINKYIYSLCVYAYLLFFTYSQQESIL